MSDTISSLISGIIRSKGLVVETAKKFGLITEEQVETAKLADVATELNKVFVHEECKDLTVEIGDVITIDPGFHPRGSTITVGTDDQLKHRYTLQELTVDSPEPDATVDKHVTLASDGNPNYYYGISKVTIKPLGTQYIKVEEKVDNKNTITSSDKVLEGNVAYGRNPSTGNAQAFTGTMPDKTGYWDVIDAKTPYYRIEIPEGYHNGKTNISALVTDKTIDCPIDKTNQTKVYDTSGALLSEVIINPLPKSYADTSDASKNSTSTVIANMVLDGIDVYVHQDTVVDGKTVKESVKISGEMPNNTGSYGVIYTNTPDHRLKIPVGYHDGNTTITALAEPLTVSFDNNYKGKAFNLSSNENKFYTSVSIPDLPPRFGDVTGCTVSTNAASRVLSGTTVMAIDSSGKAVKIGGEMYNVGKWDYEVDGINYTGTKIPPGYHSGLGEITFDDSVIIGLLQQI